MYTMIPPLIHHFTVHENGSSHSPVILLPQVIWKNYLYKKYINRIEINNILHYIIYGWNTYSKDRCRRANRRGHTGHLLCVMLCCLSLLIIKQRRCCTMNKLTNLIFALTFFVSAITILYMVIQII